MRHRDERRPGPRPDREDGDFLFWYWLPVAGVAIGLTFLLLGCWSAASPTLL